MNRRTGEYHYHGGGPAASSAAPLAVARSQPRLKARSSARTTARLLPARPIAVPRNDSPNAGRYPVVGPEDLARAERESTALSLFEKAQDREASSNHLAAIAIYQGILRDYKKTVAATKSRQRLEYLQTHEPLRTWTNKSGKFKILARFVKLDGDVVVLKKEDGKTIRVKYLDLSLESRAYAKLRAKGPLVAPIGP